VNKFDSRTERFTRYRHDPSNSNSIAADSVNSIARDSRGCLWFGTEASGLDKFDPTTGRFTHYLNDSDGVFVGRITRVIGDRQGEIWFVGERGLFHLKPATGEITRPPATRNGLGADYVYEDEAGNFWILAYAPVVGLVKYDPHAERVATYPVGAGGVGPPMDCTGTTVKTERSPATRKARGYPAARFAAFWRMGLVAFGSAPSMAYPALIHRGKDLETMTCPTGCRRMSSAGPVTHKGQDGEMFFGGSNGFNAFFPDNVRDNPYVPPVVITSLKIFNKAVPIGPRSVLKKAIPYVDSLTLSYRENVFSFEFAALSYANSEKNRYRYKLENFEPGWNEVGSKQRLATYTNLDPGKYVFYVQGSNSDGVWNEQGASLIIIVTPPWWKTTWFRVLCLFFVLTLLSAAYRWRLRQLHDQFEMTLDARVSERTRIARDLHDTLLQSFHGLLLRFQIVSQLLPERPVEAKDQLDRTIDRAANAITEGRDAIQGLRASTLEANDLARAINTLGEELSTDPANEEPPAFRVTVEGESRDLHPILRDEIFRVATEALRNAFRHAQARQVEVEIRYDDQEFRVRVRDDGKGIDMTVLSGQEPEGHYGLPGMRERARLIGGKLVVWSEVGAGTEVELRIPAAMAYITASKRSWVAELITRK
jgi:signal transduction histidine kinase